MGQENLLEIKKLSIAMKIYENSFYTLKNVEFSLKKGNILGIVGESGSGKTMTMLSIIGLLPHNAVVHSESKIYFKSRQFGKINLAAFSKKDKRWLTLRGREISMIFQEPSSAFCPVYKVFDYFKEIFKNHYPEISDKTIKEKALEILNKVEIPNPEICLNQYPFELSGGMKQRVMIGLSIATHPNLIIADEPTTALDVTVQAQILNLLKKFNEEMEITIILISHNLGVIRQISKEILVLYLGEVMEIGPTEEIINNPLHPYTKLLIKCMPFYNRKGQPLSIIPGDIPHPLERPKGCAFANRCPYSIKGLCDKETPMLIEYKKNHKVKCFLFGERTNGIPFN